MLNDCLIFYKDQILPFDCYFCYFTASFFFRFTPWRPHTHNGVQSFLKSHLKLLCSYDFTNSISCYKEQDIWFSFCVKIVPQRTVKRRSMVRFSSIHLLIQVWKGWIWLFSNLVENLVKLVKRKVFKCDFKSGLTPVLTLSQLLFTFQQLSSRFLQNLFYLFFRHSLLVWEPGLVDHMETGGALSPIYLIYNNPIPIREGRLSPLYKYFIPGVIEIRDKRCKLLMYCHQYSFGGKYDLIQLHRQIIHQNDGIIHEKLI